jgi:hypothetical protein
VRHCRLTLEWWTGWFRNISASIEYVEHFLNQFKLAPQHLNGNFSYLFEQRWVENPASVHV